MATKKAPIVEQKVKKAIKTGNTAPVKSELQRMSDKLKPGTAISIPDGNYTYKRAWIIKEIPTAENAMDQYMITLGKGKPRMVMSMSAIHAAELVKNHA